MEERKKNVEEGEERIKKIEERLKVATSTCKCWIWLSTLSTTVFYNGIQAVYIDQKNPYITCFQLLQSRTSNPV